MRFSLVVVSILSCRSNLVILGLHHASNESLANELLRAEEDSMKIESGNLFDKSEAFRDQKPSQKHSGDNGIHDNTKRSSGFGSDVVDSDIDKVKYTSANIEDRSLISSNDFNSNGLFPLQSIPKEESGRLGENDHLILSSGFNKYVELTTVRESVGNNSSVTATSLQVGVSYQGSVSNQHYVYFKFNYYYPNNLTVNNEESSSSSSTSNLLAIQQQQKVSSGTIRLTGYNYYSLLSIFLLNVMWHV